MADLVGYEGLQRRLSAIGDTRLGRPLLSRLALRAVREQKRLVQRRTGNAGRSIHVGSVTDTYADTIASASYAAILEHGSRAHDIRPRIRKVLRWAANARDVRLTGSPRSGTKDFRFARLVHHPGTRPYPFMEPGARKALEDERLTDVVVTAWNRAD
jgi:hypothetical protein